MIRIAVCSNDVTILNQIKEMVNYYAQRNGILISINCFLNPLYLLDAMSDDFQIYFLDIEMPLAKKKRIVHSIRKMDRYAYLVFITTADDFVHDFSCIQSVSYIVKPINQSYFEKEMDRARRHVKKVEKKYLVIRNNDGYFKIYLSGVYYAETYNRNLLIHTDYGDFLCFKKMQQLEDELAYHSFIRCHKSYIVNMDFIKEVGSSSIKMENNDIILVSKWRRKNVVESLIKHVENV